MKVKYGNILLATVFSIIAAVAVSCSEKAEKEHVTDSAMTFQVEQTQLSKVTANGEWDGNERIAVKIGTKIKEYHATDRSGSTATIEGISPEQTHWWQNTSSVKVMAWMVGSEYHTDLEQIGGWSDQSSSDK